MQLIFFFFKQKTAYEMRIRDWSSDVCSSDLAEADSRHQRQRDDHRIAEPVMVPPDVQHDLEGTDPEDQQGKADIVDGQLHPLGFHRAQQRQRRKDAQGGDGQVDEEDPVPAPVVADISRSEEHTSELQSLMRISYAVFCLKKKKSKPNHSTSS